MKYLTRIIFFAFLLLPLGLQGQKYLLLQKVNRPYKIMYEEGDEIRFRMKGEKFFIKALILGFEEEVIKFHYYRIHIDEIAEIDVERKNFTVFSFRSSPGKLVISGLAFIAIDQLNQTVIQRESFGISKETLIIGSILSGSGFLLKLVQKKKWKLNKKKHMIEIINISDQREKNVF